MHFMNLSSISASPSEVLLANPEYLGACLGIGSWSVSESWLPAWSLSLGGAVPPTLGLIAGIRGGGEVGGRRGGRKLKGKGGGFEEGQFLEEMEVYEGACGGNLK